MTVLHVLASVWLGAVGLAGLFILAWIGWKMACPPKRPAVATFLTLTASAVAVDRRVTYMRRTVHESAVEKRLSPRLPRLE